jgi:hypothetical protein
MTLEEAAQYAKMGQAMLYDFARKGNDSAHRMGRVRWFDLENLDGSLKTGKFDSSDEE